MTVRKWRPVRAPLSCAACGAQDSTFSASRTSGLFGQLTRFPISLKRIGNGNDIGPSANRFPTLAPDPPLDLLFGAPNGNEGVGRSP